MSTCPRVASAIIISGAEDAVLDDETYDLGAEDELAGRPRRPGFPVEPRRLWLILRENRQPLLKAFLIASAVALLASFFVPQTYESSAQLLYEGTPVLEPGRPQPKPDAFVQSATAPAQLREVRERLGWDVSIDELESVIDVTLDGEASMYIEGEAGTAEDAHQLTRAVLEVFLARQSSFNARKLEMLMEENSAALVRAKERREQANKAYDAFRAKSGKANLIREQQNLLTRAAEFRAKADEAAVEVAAQQARVTELEKAQRELPNQIVASATKGSPIDTPLAQARSELASARASLSEAHPTVQALKQRVASLQAQRRGQRTEVGEQTLAANPARAVVDQQLATARAALAAARERESALRLLLDANKAEVDLLSLEEGEARQVLGELELADNRFEALTQRGAALRDAAVGQLTGFRVLSVPMLPEESQRSMPLVVLLLLLPVLTVLIFSLVLIGRGLKTLTVEAPREVAWWGNGPVLGTSIWPREADALESFVAELEDHGVHGAGRTLVVPASEAEREIACAFAMRLADAPWLAAAILDVEAAKESFGPPLVSPAPGVHAPSPSDRPKRLSTQGTPSVSHGRAVPTMQGFVPPTETGSTPSSPPVVTPPPASQAPGPSSSRPPRKKTMIGLPAVKGSGGTRISTGSSQPTLSVKSPSTSSGPTPFRRRRGARASIRMVVPVTSSAAASTVSTARDSDVDERAFLLTRPVPVASDETPSNVGQAVHLSTDSSEAAASNAVMRAAVKLLGHDDDEVMGLRRSEPPAPPVLGDVTGVALAWNGPLSGPLLRRAARLAHRVMVVVSSGMSAMDLARVHTRLGRESGVGFVLVNLSDAYVDLHDRVGPVSEFWEGARDKEPDESRAP
jgi:uncharacterized protein involved in exopolysaccharide biosynthesis